MSKNIMQNNIRNSIDVILPTFNRCYILWKAINSVLAQDFPYFKLIIVDDGSTDDTKKLIKQFVDPRIIFISRSHKGVSAARNFGIKIGNSPYIAYIDSDNIWQSNYLSTMVNALNNNKNAVLAYCGLNYVLQRVSVDYTKEIIMENTGMPADEITLENLWNKKVYLDTNQIVHKKRIIDKVGLWDEKLSVLTDWDFVIRVYKAFPKKFIAIKKTLVTYTRQIGFSDSISANNNSALAYKRIYGKHIKLFKKAPTWVKQLS